MPPDGFWHEALLYTGTEEFVAHALTFLDQAVQADEPALVMTDGGKSEHLRVALGDHADTVSFADMAVVGRNPAQIIPAWRDFADTHAGRDALWGIGEPIWAGRSAAELVECRQHEALLNVAFADCPQFRLLCPYDTATLAPEDVDAAHTTHPRICCRDGPSASTRFAGVDVGGLLAESLPPPHGATVAVEFGYDDLAAVRHHMENVAIAAGLGPRQVKDVVLAVDEVATNSQRHGGGGGVLTSWVDAGTLVCEIHDAGFVTDPLAGRRRPPPSQLGGRGLWIANQLSDLVQVRSSASGTVVRLHKRIDPPW
jgi:anti-sigma regulatory factor (Ser/Thr protein kinase)